MRKRYSYLIPVLSLVLDLLLIVAVVFYVNDKEYLNQSFLIFAIVFWIISTQLTNYYRVNRQTSIFRTFTLIVIQAVVFILGFFSYFSIFREGDVVHHQFKILTSILLGVTFLKLLLFYALKRYRSQGKNYRKVIVLGYDETSQNVIQLFKNRSDLGYRFQGFFTDNEVDDEGNLGKIKDSLSYLQKKGIEQLIFKK